METHFHFSCAREVGGEGSELSRDSRGRPVHPDVRVVWQLSLPTPGEARLGAARGGE